MAGQPERDAVTRIPGAALPQHGTACAIAFEELHHYEELQRSGTKHISYEVRFVGSQNLRALTASILQPVRVILIYSTCAVCATSAACCLSCTRLDYVRSSRPSMTVSSDYSIVLPRNSVTLQQINFTEEDTFSTLASVMDPDTKECVLMKTARLDPKDGIPPSAIREASLLRSLHHPNVIRYHPLPPHSLVPACRPIILALLGHRWVHSSLQPSLTDVLWGAQGLRRHL